MTSVDDFVAVQNEFSYQRELMEAAHPRSPQWPTLVKKLIARQPFCSFCGQDKDLVGHHILPYHKYPELELVETNILIVGEGCTTGNHHLLMCHFGNFHKWNPDARRLASTF